MGLPTTWDEDGGYAEFQAGEVMLAIFSRAEMSSVVALRPSGDAAVLVLEANDVDAACETLRERGVDVSEPRDRPEWGIRVAHTRDPDGNLVELYHDIEWVHE